jgi:hypothetical protein
MYLFRRLLIFINNRGISQVIVDSGIASAALILGTTMVKFIECRDQEIYKPVSVPLPVAPLPRLPSCPRSQSPSSPSHKQLERDEREP